MGCRFVGLKEESIYGLTTATDPDWHHETISKSSAALNDEPVLTPNGSRMHKRARAGAMKPTASIESRVDLQRFGHYLKGFLDQYNYTDDTSGTSGKHIHEFYGGEVNKLPSFTAWMTFDVMMKKLVGMLVDELKLEVADEYLTCSTEWIYKDQTADPMDASQFDKILVEGDIPIMFYDVMLEIDDDVPPGVVSSFNMEGKNNHNVEKTLGLGSRRPQKRATAQKREITLSIVSSMEEETLSFIRQAEHGEDANTPSDCKLYKLPLKLDIAYCENPADKLTILFPECIFKAEYEGSEADEIEVTFNLTSMGNSEVELLDGSKVITDMYCVLYNDMPEIVPA